MGKIIGKIVLGTAVITAVSFVCGVVMGYAEESFNN